MRASARVVRLRQRKNVGHDDDRDEDTFDASQESVAAREEGCKKETGRPGWLD